jgi:hypothetical protein
MPSVAGRGEGMKILQPILIVFLSILMFYMGTRYQTMRIKQEILAGSRVTIPIPSLNLTITVPSGRIMTVERVK